MHERSSMHIPRMKSKAMYFLSESFRGYDIDNEANKILVEL